MKAFKFTLSGKTAFFKTPDVNAYMYFSYGHIHRVALLGVFGAIMGYSGYGGDPKRELPEFYEKLRDIKVSVLPNSSDGIFSRKIQNFNNSTAFASREEGGNLIVKQIWLEDVSWDIYFLVDSEISTELANRIFNNRCTFIPYLGSNDHLANITNAEYVELNKINEFSEINSFTKSSDVIVNQNRQVFKYEEILPYKLEPETERYIFEKFIFTNGKVKINNDSIEVYSHDGRKLIFYGAD